MSTRPAGLLAVVCLLTMACERRVTVDSARRVGARPVADAGRGSGDESLANVGGDASTDGSAGASSTDAGSAAAPSPATATSYLVNPAHTNFAPGSSLVPPLARAWTAHLAGAASYPLIADGRVFVVSASSASPSGVATGGTSLVALDSGTGATLWTASLPGGFGAHAFDGGRVFTVDGAGTVTAFDAATGRPEWSQSMVGPETWSFYTVPTAYRGVLYTSAAGDGGTLFAFDEATGQRLFQKNDQHTGDGSPPALSDEGLVVAYGCEETYKLDRLTGEGIWHYATGCGGGGGDTPVLAGGRVYVTDPLANVVLDATTGGSVGTFVAVDTPAFDDTLSVFAAGTQLTAVSRGSGQTAWTFAAMGGATFLAPPLLAAGYVYTVDFTGTLTAFDESTGSAVWSDPAAFRAQGAGIAPPALGAAGNLLVVPEGPDVVAYVSTSDAGAAPSGGGDTQGPCVWTLHPGQQPATGYAPESVAIGDLNGDGKPDLAVANFNSASDVQPYNAGTVSVLLGNGDGTFQSHVDYVTGIGTDAVAIADLNRDGKLDLAVLNSGGLPAIRTPAGTVSVLLGNGDGTFQPQQLTATSPGSLAFVAGDLNGDGKLDLAIANDAPASLSVLMGHGDGTFEPSVTTSATGGVAVALALADLDGDGHPDLVLADEEYHVDVLLNRGDGTFQTATAYATYANACCVSEPDAVAIADVNGDGKMDLAVSNLGGSNVSVFLGRGDGTFQPQVPYPTNRGPGPVGIADMNGDGNMDLVVADGSSPDVSVLLGHGDGSFQPQVFFAVAKDTGSFAIADLNGDRRPDVVAISGSDNVGILLGGCKR